MCGIIGVIGDSEVAPLLMRGLRRLEYRGYDSAGIATLVENRIERYRAEGKLVNLEGVLAALRVGGTIGIGHTRWATHGAANEVNAHPHSTGRVAVVHNGIIENFRELRDELTALGYAFASETDTEAVAQLITRYLDEGLPPIEATRTALERLDGAFALAIIFSGEPDLMIGARRGSPLVIGWGDGEMFLGSDALAIAPLTEKLSYLEDGDLVELSRNGAVVRDRDGAVAQREITSTSVGGALIGKGNHRHYMKKEIHEQPTVIGETLKSFVDAGDRSIMLPDLPFDLASVDRLTIVACGTSYYAAAVAKYWFERTAGLPVDVDVASEFRYRGAPLAAGGVALFVSQSGETADTLAAQRLAREAGQHVVAIVNVAESSMAREAAIVLQTHAGPEIGVASTKAFTCQLAVLACLAIAFAEARNAIDSDEAARMVGSLIEVPARVAEILNRDVRVGALAPWLADARTILYFGRGTAYPIALEGALKLKEISYIHAEGFAAGELKHGPIALVDETVPVVVLAPSDELFEKTASNVREVMARGGQIVLISDAAGIEALGDEAAATVELPEVDPFVAPILYAIPVQLLAYHVAVHKGTDVDQPRNLAKSVTVE